MKSEIEGQKVLVKNNNIKKKGWSEYFNNDFIGGLRLREDASLARYTFHRRNKAAKWRKH